MLELADTDQAYWAGVPSLPPDLFSSEAEAARSNPADFPGTLQEGASGDDVKKVQRKLAALGIFSGSASGSYGPSTAAAVMAFQASQDLPKTGEVDRTTWDLLITQGTGHQWLNTLTDLSSLVNQAVSPLSASPPAPALASPAPTSPGLTLADPRVWGGLALVGAALALAFSRKG
jgi:peptidoglycan hydrolase-like protein with peptidoglycan-binding domain